MHPDSAEVFGPTRCDGKDDAIEQSNEGVSDHRKLYYIQAVPQVLYSESEVKED